MQAAAANTGAGPGHGFMGMGMAGQAAVQMGAFCQMGASSRAIRCSTAHAAGTSIAAGSAAAAQAVWTCSCGHAGNAGKFCPECGKPSPPASAGWTCSCGTVNKGKFCTECGAKKPEGEPLYSCDKCGWEPKDPKHPPSSARSAATRLMTGPRRMKAGPLLLGGELYKRFVRCAYLDGDRRLMWITLWPGWGPRHRPARQRAARPFTSRRCIVT